MQSVVFDCARRVRLDEEVVVVDQLLHVEVILRLHEDVREKSRAAEVWRILDAIHQEFKDAILLVNASKCHS